MRIVSGTLKGRLISVPKNFKLRPTTDLAKESLFNILNNQVDFEDSRVLDLFAGTGSISYEFASRGCKEIIAIEKSFKHKSFIEQTLELLEIENVSVIKNDVFEFIEKCDTKFDIIFADPPYDLKNIADIPAKIFEKELLKEEGILIVEHPQHVSLKGNAHHYQTKNYGAVHFSFFE